MGLLKSAAKNIAKKVVLAAVLVAGKRVATKLFAKAEKEIKSPPAAK